jgi:uncharacterized protein YbjT (DUF2867 family)
VTTARHVIFGTGAIGPATCDALRRRGETVRLVNRRRLRRVDGVLCHRGPSGEWG